MLNRLVFQQFGNQLVLFETPELDVLPYLRVRSRGKMARKGDERPPRSKQIAMLHLVGKRLKALLHVGLSRLYHHDILFLRNFYMQTRSFPIRAEQEEEQYKTDYI